MIKKQFVNYTTIYLSLALVSGCGGKTVKDSSTDPDTTPDIIVIEEKSVVVEGTVNPTYDIEYIGSPTQKLLTLEEYNKLKEIENSNHLKEINATTAWSRGWTGQGSIIAIADSGLDVDHAEFEDKILHTQNFDRNSNDNSVVTDNVGHGTHVAGVAAGNLNGKGIVGVAPDADLIIIKSELEQDRFSFNFARHGLEIASDKGAIAYNISAGIAYDTSFFRNLRWNTEQQTFYNTDYNKFGGYNNFVSESYKWEQSDPDNQTVIVVAAGNNTYWYGAFPGIMATVTDSNNNLVLGGRMLVVGSWNSSNNDYSTYTNLSHHICLDWNDTDKICHDQYRMKDFYILAPGDNINSTLPTGSYGAKSGTSIAAPQVSGAIAILHQMWPFMTGPNLVQLVLKTANKDIPGYNENTHGQGLLDLDAATKPVGALGIPKHNHVNQGSTSLNGFIAGKPLLKENKVSLMSLDSLNRDFYIDLDQANVITDTRRTSWAHNVATRQFTNSYASFVNETFHVEDYSVSARNNSTISVGKSFGNWHFGYTREQDALLGTKFDGVFSLDEYSDTLYVNYFSTQEIAGLKFLKQVEFGLTAPQTPNSDSLIKELSLVTSTALHFGIQKELGNYNFTSTASIPTRIVSGDLELDVPVARTIDGNVLRKPTKINLNQGPTEVDFGVSLSYNTGNHNLGAYVENRVNYAGSDQDVVEYGVEYEFKF